jgi:uncharacterized protein involved in exopolysaccharide biosynthesis
VNTDLVDPHGCDDRPALNEFLLCLHERRRMALTTFAAVVAMAMLIAALVPPSYEATASVTILPAPEYTVRPSAGSSEMNNTALAMDQIMQSESEILDSDDLHLAALRLVGPGTVYPDLDPSFDPGLLHRVLHPVVHTLLSAWRPDPPDHDAALVENGLKRFRHHLRILPSKDGNVISLSFTNRDPDVAARVITALIEAYAKRRVRVYDDPQLDAVRLQAEAGSRSVAAAERALADFKRVHDISDAATQRGLMLRRRSDADQAAADAGSTVREQQARLNTISAQLKTEPENVGLYQERDPDTRVQTLLASLQDLHARRAAARGRYLDSSRTVRDLEGQIASREAELARLAKDPTASVVRTGRNPAIDQLHLDRDRAAAEHAAATARRDAAAAEAQQIGTALTTLDVNETELEILQRQVALETDALATQSHILAARRLIEAEDALRFAKVRVIQPARIPQTPRPLPMLIIAAGVLMGIVASAIRITAGFMLSQTVLTADGLAAASGLDVLAVFPRAMATAQVA